MKKVTIRGEYFGQRTMPSLNDWLKAYGRSPVIGGRFKADYTKPIIGAIRSCLRGWRVTNPPVILHYKFYERNKGIKRDIGNIMFCFAKFFEDALQHCGTIQNDNPEWIIGYETEFHWIDGEPYIEVEIEERGKRNEEEPNRDDFEVHADTQERDHTDQGA